MDEICVISLRDYDKKRQLAVLDNGVTLLLYRAEIKKFGLDCGDGKACISSETYGEISDILVKRGRERALYLLADSDKTGKQICDSLKKGMYPPEVIRDITDFLEKYGYIDDEKYSFNYIRLGLSKKSIALLCKELIYKKGVEAETVRRVAGGFETQEISEEKTIRTILAGKHFDIRSAKEGDRRRMSAYLLRRGFDYEAVMRALRPLNHDIENT